MKLTEGNYFIFEMLALEDSRITVGSRVIDGDGYRATVRYIGPVAAAKNKDEVWIGVEWDRVDRGKHDGR